MAHCTLAAFTSALPLRFSIPGRLFPKIMLGVSCARLLAYLLAAHKSRRVTLRKEMLCNGPDPALVGKHFVQIS